jgi:hypothetical protein
MIVEGTFEGRAFALTLGSLGLSSAAVKAGVSGIKWVTSLDKAREAGVLGRLGTAGRLARVGGWFYTAAELAVVLYLAETVEHKVDAALRLSDARDALAEAGARFLAAARSAPDAASLEAASGAYQDAWNAYREFLYTPLRMDEAVFAERLERLARRAKLGSDERDAALGRVGDHAALRKHLEERHGSVEGYADRLSAEDEAELQDDLRAASESYERTRGEHLRELYEEHRRGAPLLEDVYGLEWLVSGGAAGADGDPFGERDDLFANLGRARARGALEDALGSTSRNRLETYDDQDEVLRQVAASLRAADRGELAAVLEERRRGVRALAAADRQLFYGHSTGLRGAVDGE